MTASDEPIERHDVSDVVLWREQLDHVSRLLAKVRGQPPSPEGTARLSKLELRRALVASVLPGERASLCDAVARSSGAASAAMIAQRRFRSHEDEGSVVFTEPNLEPRSLPAGEAGLAWPEWVQGFCAAAIARDEGAFISLCSPASIEACSLPEDVIDGFWPFYCAALASVVVDVPSTALWLRKCEAALDDSRIAAAGLVDLRIRPTLALVKALADADAAAFQTSLHIALSAHQSYFSSRVDDRHRDWNGLLALEANSLAAIASDRGMQADVVSGYLDETLVRGEFQRMLTEVALHYPERSIASAEEASWFLDLEGFPRAGRTHRLVDDGGRLIARYEARSAPGTPLGRVGFVVLEEGADVTATLEPPLALDSGELLLLAESLARADAGSGLAEAVAAVDAALRRIPVDRDAVAEESVTSPRGRALYEAEPGRFRRDRVAAYSDALRAQLGDARSENRDAGARASALASIEVVKAQVLPILQALPHLEIGALRDQLAPRDADYARAFVGDAVEVARESYRALWEAGVPMQRPASDQTEIRCQAAPAGMLGDANELSYHFPNGYRGIARWLAPNVVWLAWKYTRAGATSGLSFDGLAWMEDHWAWFPKPYRVLRELGVRDD